MKISIFLASVFLLIGMSISENANAQRGPRTPRQKAVAVHHADKVHARRVIRRTAYVILAAQKKVQENKNYTGDLARAIAHQRYARKLYFRGEFLRAMHQSRRARQFAILAIQANKGTETADMKLDPQDEQVMKENPVNDADLDKDLNTDSPGYSQKDQDFVNAALDDIDLTDVE
ncbi:MAG TPA: hypothetical protein VFJ43_01790 [Bacteroidia bacterium]|nr:hypothetical protein [Bacteroidia bacterium]